MTRLISLREIDKLRSWITSKDRPKGSRQSMKEISKDKPIPLKDAGAWLEAGLPASYGTDQNRPWAQVLRTLTHGVYGAST